MTSTTVPFSALVASDEINARAKTTEALDELARLADRGLTTAELAARFGIADRTVRQHLALGRLAPEVRSAWRKGKIDAEAARAFAIAPDPATQAAVLAELGSQVSEWRVRSKLVASRERVDQSDELALIGEEAYLAAGGTIDEDLFTEARYVADVPLARRLARERLQAECARLRAAGWAWAEIEDEDDAIDKWDLDHVRGDEGDMETPEGDYTAAEKRRSGCFVAIAYDGSVQVSTGLIRPDGDAQADLEEYIDDDRGGDVMEDAAGASSAAGLLAGATDDDTSPQISAALVEALTTQQTIVAQRLLARDPMLALRALVATWQTDGGYTGFSPLRTHRNGYCDGRREITYDEHRFARSLGANCNTLEVLADDLADLIAGTLDLRCYNPASPRENEAALVAAMNGTAYLAEMRATFVAADYFARVPKSLAIEALEEMHDGGHYFGLAGRPDLERMKKGELAQWAAEQAQACGWLPALLRHPSYTLVIADKLEKPARRRGGKMAAAEQSAELDEPAPRRTGRASA